ncbi:30S ribosomal protein S6 [Patescibacteria group bacterium]|nr:30S ribosomal protein S6 [Patescibacteria group bacterium]
MSKSKASGLSRYEMLFIVPNNYTEDEAKSIAEKVEGIVTENGANIVFREFWGKKKLAYVIKQNHYGYYSLCEFDIERNALTKIDRTLRLSNEVLRHQIISIPVVSDEERLAIKEKQTQASKNDKKEEKPNNKEKISKVVTKKEKKDEKKDDGKADLKDLDKKLEGIISAKDLI